MEHLPEPLPANPLTYISQWIEDARGEGIIPNPDAMALATIDANGFPASRIVLCKQVVKEPGYLVFYTNYDSHKAQAIEANKMVAGVFHWDHLNRQVRFEGLAIRSPESESDAYFASRDRESQVGAWTSAQSQNIDSRKALMGKHVATTRKLASLQEDSGRDAIPRPPFWGGFRIGLRAVELWTRGKSRLHDRGRWERDLSVVDNEFQGGPWTAKRLQP
jgi:pyridoxamine 5'-phosphate oxidase